MKLALRWIAVIAAFLLAACKPATREFKLQHGQVVQTDASKKTVVVRHNDIPGFMPGMTMPYKVKDPGLLNGLQPGDIIDANVQVLRDGSDFWLEAIHITDTSARNGGQSAAHMLKPGEAVPPLELTNQDGKKFHLTDFKGKAVLVTFIYTRCPLPQFCPRLTSQFARIQQNLAKTPEDYARTHLLTISFDPKYDTPEVLRKYGLAYLGDDPSGFAHWDFATTSPDQLRTLADTFGLLYIEEDNQISHTMNIVLIGPDQKIVKYWSGDWTKEELEDALRKAAQAAPAHRG
jgi:protein SCO1/2